MSNEFSMQVSFKIKNEAHFNDIEELLEHLEIYEEEDAQAILDKYNTAPSAVCCQSATTIHTNYNPSDNLINMYTQTYDENVDDMTVTFNLAKLSVDIIVEGRDNEAADYCSALVLILITSGVTSLSAVASSDYWQLNLSQNKQGLISLELNEYES